MLEIISSYFGILLLGFERILFVKMNLNKEVICSKLKFVLNLFCVSFLEILCSLYLNGIYKTIFLYVIYIFQIKILFNTNYIKTIFLTFFYALILLFSDLIGVFFVTHIFDISIISVISGTIISSVLVCLIFALIAYLLKIPLRKVLNAKISNNVKIVFLSMSTLLCVIFFLYIFETKFLGYENFLPYLISMFVLLIILFSLIRQTFINNKLTNEYDQLLKFMTTYENEIEKQRILRHETKNEFLTIKAKICDKQKNKEIIEYIDEILKDKVIVNQEKYAKFGYLPPNGIKGLCYFKVQEAENVGINVSINISSKIKKSTIYKLNIKNQRNLGKILGVFLDNAIEASVKSKEKQLGIEIYVGKNYETKIIISNTYNNIINKSKIGKERFTTKGKNRGHGLLLVKQIVKDNKIFEVKTDIVNSLYIQTLIIKKD